jgi:hypothetical protein
MAPDVMLTEIGSAMSSVVDPDLRARLTQKYLALLQTWQGFRRRGNQVDVTSDRFIPEVENLYAATRGGQASYKLSPALGTINNRFHRAYTDAVGSLDRLEQMANAQYDIGLKGRWLGEVRDLREKMDYYNDQASVSSANVNLSQLDALTSQVQQFLAAQLMPREIRWRKQLGLEARRYSARGDSGVVARAARPDLWYVGRKPARYYRREAMKHGYTQQPTSGRPSLSGDLFDEISQFATSLWSGVESGVKENADARYAEFEDAVKRTAAIRKRQDAHRILIEGIRAEDAARAIDLNTNLEERRKQLVNVEAQLREIADSLKRLTFNKWDSPGQLVAQHLGKLETEQRAAVVLYGEDIQEALANVAALEEADARFERDVEGFVNPVVVAAAGTAGIGVLAAAGIGAYLLMRKK